MPHKQMNTVLDYDAVITSAKQQAYSVTAIICFGALLAGAFSAYYYDPASFRNHLFADGSASIALAVVFFFLRKLENVIWVERISALMLTFYLLFWAVLNFTEARIPGNHLVISNAPLFTFTIICYSLALPLKWVMPATLTFFFVYVALVWANLMRFEWSEFHGVQITSDIMMLCVTLTVNLLATYSNTLFESQRQTRDIHEQANTDVLTGLPNRRAMYHLLKQRSKQIVLQIDVDHFKSINDTFGHEQGDEVLTHVAQVLNDSFSDCGVVARWGGEEFIAILHDFNMDDALALAEKARQDIESTEFICPLTVSIGLTEQEQGESLKDALNRADKLLYQAKAAGRNTIKTSAGTSKSV